MIKKAVFLFIVVMGLILLVAGVASGPPPVSASMTAAKLRTCYVDFNHDGVVDVGDIMRVADCWRSTDSADIALYDLNGDGIINVVDIMLVAARWGNHCPALFAVDLGGGDTDPTRRNLAAEAGFRLHRTSVSWASVEPDNVDLTNPANGNWPDSTFNIYRNDRRLIPYVIVMDNPSWAASKACGPIDSEDLDDFGEFVEQLVSRYADVTPFWVFYNEEDQRTTVPNDAGGCWGGHGVEYAQMLAVAWDAAHSADPDAQVIFGAVAYEPVWDGGTTWDWFFYRDAFQYMQAYPRPSGHDYVDIIAANQYNFRRDDWDRALPTYQEIIAKFRWAKDDDYFNASTAKAYSVYQWQSAYGLDKPMASGEVGLQVSSGCSVSTCEELQARHAVHVNVRGMAAGLKIICWYTLVDKPSDSLKYGLLRSETDPRPAYTAYQVLTEQLDGYEFDQQLDAGNAMIQAYRFDKGGVKKLVLWRDNGWKIKDQSLIATETMTISATELGTGWTGRVRVTDKLGNVNTYGDLGDPSVSLTFSSDPIYVEAY